MIRLIVEDYCHNCPEFEPAINKAKFLLDTTVVTTDTNIKCQHANRCKNIKKCLERVDK